MSVAWSASIITPDLATRVDVSTLLSSFAGVSRHLAGGEWELSLPASVWPRLATVWPAQDAAPLLFVLRWSDPNAGVVISGPVRSARLERTAGLETVKLSGVDEYANLFGGRLIYPQPADAPPWTTSAYHSLTGQASAVIAQLISSHVGIDAVTNRELPGVLVVDSGAGATRTWRYRLASLADAVADVANGEGVAVDVRRQLDGTFLVRVAETQVRTQFVIDETKLADFSVTLDAGAATTVISGGSGSETSRLFAIAGDTVTGAARREVFDDQRIIATQPTLQAAADARRSADSASTSLSGTLLPAANVRWREQYELGDSITLSAQSVRYPAQVTAVAVRVDADGLTVSPVLGKAARFALTQLVRDVSGMSSRLSSLEVS